MSVSRIMASWKLGCHIRSAFIRCVEDLLNLKHTHVLFSLYRQKKMKGLLFYILSLLRSIQKANSATARENRLWTSRQHPLPPLLFHAWYLLQKLSNGSTSRSSVKSLRIDWKDCTNTMKSVPWNNLGSMLRQQQRMELRQLKKRREVYESLRLWVEKISMSTDLCPVRIAEPGLG